MKRWGDFARVYDNDFLYIINTAKIENPYRDSEIYIPWFYIHIASRDAKKRKLSDEQDAKCRLVGKTFNIATMNKIETAIKEYLNYYKPLHIEISAYGDDFGRRINLYFRRLERMGYALCDVDNDTFYEVAYFLERKENEDAHN